MSIDVATASAVKFSNAVTTGDAGVLDGYSIEVMPRTAAKIDSFRDLLPAGTRVYVACVEGTDFADMIATVQRIRDEGFDVMPHIPARLTPDAGTLETWIKRYAEEAGVDQALVLGGGVKNPVGDFHSSMQLLETGLFDKYGFKRLHIAGHPEGNVDIDKDGTSRVVDSALNWKQDFSLRTDADMAIATQFFFDSNPVIAWAEHLREMGVDLPIHVGIAGPTKLQTLIKFALACGVGPSVKVLKKRALDVTKLLLPYEPTEVLAGIADYRRSNPSSAIAQIHLFPLGGIRASVNWAEEYKHKERHASVA